MRPNQTYALRLIVACMALLAAAPATHAQNDQAPPPFESSLSDDAYQQGLEAMLPEIQAKLDRPNHGPPGARGPIISEVTPNSQATDIGLTLGSVILSVNGVETLERLDADAVLNQPGRRELEWLDAEGELHRAAVRPGVIGFWKTEHQDVFAWYARSDARDDAWDSHILLAIHLLGRVDSAQNDDELELAENALARAVEAGFPNRPLLDSLGAYLAVMRCDFQTAMRYIRRLPWSSREMRYLMPPRSRLQVARAINDVPYIQELLLAHEHIGMAVDEQTYERWLDDAFEGLDGPSASELAEHRTPQTINAQLIQDPALFRNNAAFLRNNILALQPVASNIGAGHYSVAVLMHPGGLEDFEIRFRLKLAPSLPQHPRFSDQLTFHIYDRQRIARAGSLWEDENTFFGMSLEFDDNGAVYGRAGAYPFTSTWSMPCPQVDATGQTLNEFRFIRVGSRVQILLGDQSLLDTHVDPDETDLSIMLHMVGIDYSDLVMQVNALVQEGDAPQ